MKSPAPSVTVPRRDRGAPERVGRGVAAVAERDGAGGDVAVDARQRDRNLVVLAPPVGLAALSCQSRAPQSAVVSSVKVLLGGAAGVAGIVGQRGRHR